MQVAGLQVQDCRCRLQIEACSSQMTKLTRHLHPAQLAFCHSCNSSANHRHRIAHAHHAAFDHARHHADAADNRIRHTGVERGELVAWLAQRNQLDHGVEADAHQRAGGLLGELNALDDQVLAKTPGSAG